MFIVFVDNQEPGIFESKQEAFDFAKSAVASHEDAYTAKIYKANLIAIAETAVTINKVRKQKIVKQEVFEKAKDALIERKKKVTPVLSPELLEIAGDAVIPPEMDEVEENDIPIGARCALDRNMAVGRKKGPTGEYVYLCMDCMGSVING